MSAIEKVLEINPNVIYEVYYYAPFKVKADMFNDVAADYPPFIGKVVGEIHVYPESIVVIPIDEHVVDTQDQPVNLYIIPAIAVVEIKPFAYRKEKKP